MNCQELATAAIEQMDIKMFILNNQHLGMVVQWEDRFYKVPSATPFMRAVKTDLAPQSRACTQCIQCLLRLLPSAVTALNGDAGQQSAHVPGPTREGVPCVWRPQRHLPRFCHDGQFFWSQGQACQQAGRAPACHPGPLPTLLPSHERLRTCELLFPAVMEQRTCCAETVPAQCHHDRRDLLTPGLALQEMLAMEGPFLLDIMVPHIQNVLPIIPGGGSFQEVITTGDGLDTY